MSDKDTDKFTQALINLNVKEYKFEGADPTNETEFLTGFKKLLVLMIVVVLFIQMMLVSLELLGQK